jgi:valyl-tRNA synthetase
MPDRWILSRLNRLVANVTRLIDNYQLGEAGRQLYDFFWSEFADWYIEVAKIRLYGTDSRAQATARRVLVHVLDRSLRMLHPFIPFVTEAAWLHLPHEGESLMIAQWPSQSPALLDDEAEAEMLILIEIVRAIRNIRSEYNVEPARQIAAYIAAGDSYELVNRHQDIVTSLARLDGEQLNLSATLPEKPSQAAGQVIGGGIEIYLPLAGMIDVDAERVRCQQEIAQLEKRIAASKAKLANPGFVQKAPAEVVERERERLADLELQATKTWDRLRELG